MYAAHLRSPAMVLLNPSRLLFLLFLNLSTISSLRDILCHDPDVGGTTQNRDRKFILFGSDNSQGAGIGNLLIFFPSVYYFAAFTGRDIILSDKSIVGENFLHDQSHRFDFLV
jgi:hypothetical protein